MKCALRRRRLSSHLQIGVRCDILYKMKKDVLHNRTVPRRLTSAQIIPLGFLLLILLGTGLLWLPFAAAPGAHTSFLTALFTATTSVCVTGLVVVDTYAHWSLFGKLVILLLIQLGGLGVIAVSSSILLLMRRRLSIRDRVLLRDAFSLDSISGLVGFLRRVFVGVFAVEGVGALLYAFAFVPRYGLVKGVWFSIFHAVSAFCNAGLDLIGPDSLLSYADNAWVLSVTMALIVLGGLGFVVWFDCQAVLGSRLRHGKARLSVHSRLVLWLTLALIASGTGLVLLLEYRNPATLGAMPFGQKLLHSLFQSVTFRTAGFAAIPQGGLMDATVLIGCLYMFIGGSPMGTAGGVKTVTMLVLVAEALAHVRGRSETVLLRRRVSPALIRKATSILFVSLTVSLGMSAALLLTDGLPLSDTLYEVFSATATVGLSKGITAHLSVAGRWIIILCMYLGRIGPISLALFFGGDEAQKNEIRHAKGSFYVG